MNEQAIKSKAVGMPAITMMYGTLLMIIGVAGYVISGGASVTALIPAFFGMVFESLGILAFQEKLRKHLMHAAAVLALLAIIGTISGLLKLPTLLAGGELERPMAVVSQAIMCLLSLGFLALCVRSFVAARMKAK